MVEKRIQASMDVKKRKPDEHKSASDEASKQMMIKKLHYHSIQQEQLNEEVPAAENIYHKINSRYIT